MGILVKQGGMLTMVQDMGRFGYQTYGISVTGASDLRAFETGNILVGNEENAAGLEVTMVGLQLEFTEPNVIAVTGGDMGPLLNNEPLAMYSAIAVKAGDVLRFSAFKSGFRAYIAFAGGLDVPEVFGSRSTHQRCKFGGFEGRKLAANDRIGFLAPKASLPAMQARKTEPESYCANPAVVRAVLGPQDDYFTQKGIDTFFSGVYTATQEMDRLGARLEGPEIEHAKQAGIISDGVAFGSVQVPANGQPIVMLADRQSTGGYTKIATVISSDIPLLAQLTPGKKVMFRQVSVEQAQEIYMEERNKLQALKDSIAAACKEDALLDRTLTVTVNGRTCRVRVQEVADFET